jgi:hypothetical protein
VAVGLSGCSQDAGKKTDSSEIPEISVPPATPAAPVKPPGAALPPPEALTDVLTRLADPAVPGSDKANLVEGSTPETAGALDRFTTAARDGGYLPMTFAANNLAWSGQNPSAVTATVVITTANPEHREFTFPMEFTALPPGWQLSKKTADMLLALSNSRTSTLAPSPAPAPSSPPGADQVPDLPAPATTPNPGPSPAPAPPATSSAIPTPGS